MTYAAGGGILVVMDSDFETVLEETEDWAYVATAAGVEYVDLNPDEDHGHAVTPVD